MDIQPSIAENVRSTGWFRPELVLDLGTLALFLLDLAWRRSAGAGPPARRRHAGRLRPGRAAASRTSPGAAQSLFNGMIANDAFATFFKWLFLAGGALTVLIAGPRGTIPAPASGQFYALLLAIVLGLFLMASADRPAHDLHVHRAGLAW